MFKKQNEFKHIINIATEIKRKASFLKINCLETKLRLLAIDSIFRLRLSLES